MYVDISDLVMETGDKIVIHLTNNEDIDEFGMAVKTSNSIIRTKAIITEEDIETTNTSSGRYSEESSFNLYIPTKITKKYNLTGAIVEVEGMDELVITEKSIDRKYTSHNMYNATKRRFGDDSLYRRSL